MKRRTFIAGSAALAGVLAAPSISRGQTPRVLRLGTVQSAEHAQTAGARRAAELIQQRSNGRLSLQVFPAGQLGRGQDMVQQMSDGNLDFVIEGPALMAQWVRRMSIFEAPYLARDWDHFKAMMNTPFARSAGQELIERRNIRIVGVWYFGTRQLTTRDRAINTPADMQGLRIRVPEVPLYLDMIRALGATPTPVAFAEVYLALQTGTVAGQENPLPTIFASRFHEVQRFINLTSHITQGLLLMGSERAWSSLAEADRAMVQAALAEGAAVNDTTLQRQEAELLTTFQQANVTIVRPNLDPFRAAMATVYPRYEEAWGAGAVDQLRNAR